MDQNSLILRVTEAQELISEGRQWHETDGFEAKGRKRRNMGLDRMADIIHKVRANAATDLLSVALVEHSIVNQELRLCDPADEHGIESLEHALSELDDAFLALRVVDDAALYRAADMTYPHKERFRRKGLPKDAFHNACDSQVTRIGNSLKALGLSLAEKALMEERSENLKAAKDAYMDKQRAALATTENQEPT
jgi:hypothetical protein